jgi:hypothetical protein
MTALSPKLNVVPTRFSSRNEQDPEKYIEKFELASECNNWLPEHRLKFLPTYLDGTAFTWYINYKKEFDRRAMAAARVLDPKNPQPVPLDYPTLKTDFIDAFPSIAKIEVAERKLDKRRQLSSESPEDYMYDMFDLCKAFDPHMPEDAIVRKTIKGLRPGYLEKINFADPQNMDDLLKAIRKIKETNYLLDQTFETQSTLAVLPATQKTDPEVSKALLALNEALSSQTSLIQKLQQQQNKMAENNNKEARNPNSNNWNRNQNNWPRNQNPNNRNWSNQWSQNNTNQGNQQVRQYTCQICRRNTHDLQNCYFNLRNPANNPGNNQRNNRGNQQNYNSGNNPTNQGNAN